MNPRVAIPIHFDDYGVFRSPRSDFERAAARAGLQDRLRLLTRGERYTWEMGAAAWQADRPPPPSAP